MDRSMKFFAEVENFEKNLNKLKQDKTTLPEEIALLEEDKRQYIMNKMKICLQDEGYSLIVEDIAKFLDIDEKQVRANIIPLLDYVRVPEGAADFFSIEFNKEMSFLEMRIKKWKRLFICKKSFETFLESHLVMYCPYTTIRWSEKECRYVPIGTGETPIAYSRSFNAHLIRKCNIASMIRTRKTSDFIRKTKNDITHARMLGQISSERLQAEMDYLSSNKHELDVPVHNQEIKNYIEKTFNYKFHLYKSIEDKEKPLYTEKRKTADETRVKPTVLFWFVERGGVQ